MPVDWGYKKNNGPDTWKNTFPLATSGNRQSPIDIITDNIKLEELEKPLKWSYPIGCAQTIANTGASWKIVMEGNCTLSGGPLDGEYQLWQFHCHWGSSDSRGSEHTVDGKEYPGEMHFVHYKKAYLTPKEAVSSQDGLCVLSRFLEVHSYLGGGTEANDPAIAKVLKLLPSVRNKGQKVTLEKDAEKPEPKAFLPRSKDSDRSYWTYEGSLTTPPLLECVVWIVLTDPLKVTAEQMQLLRSSLKWTADDCSRRRDGSDGGKREDNDEIPEDGDDFIRDNFRPTQPVNDRVVKFARNEG